MIAGRRTLYQHLSRVRGDYSRLLDAPLAYMQTLILRQGETVDRRQEGLILTEAGKQFASVFVGVDGRSAYRDDTVPLSPFADMLNRHLAAVQADVVFAHARWLRANLPDDVFGWLAREPVAEFASNPLAQYEPAHTWVDPRGYRLSDRIWNTSNRTRAQIDALLADGIRQGRGSLALSRELERFTRPERATLRTRRPYGVDASYDAMRLARTEISRAHMQATFAASRANPLVDRMDYALSMSHPRVDICDKFASIDMQGGRIREPYRIEECPHPVDDTHPHCLCHVRSAVTSSREEVIAQLRALMNGGQPAPLTPARPRSLLGQMLGAGLLTYVFWGEF